MNFRWPWITIPFAVVFCIWFMSGASPSFDFEDIAAAMGVVNTRRYAELAAFGFIGIAIALLARLWRSS
ncbi:MAG: hypothetical protein H6819_02305 [Phycisphaerales bacterium]|nr:hypothetical protein [Phycisphaerales bacterium]MCB9856955.1 hypothetical protein [Phycisphaerales bacterium]MCB9861918.1 hypothetical protein [Phycisphaerales bacterium]